MQSFLLINANIYTMESESPFEGWIEIENGIIKAIHEGAAPEAENILDCHGGDLYPGFIDIHCHLGMLEDSLGFEGDDCNEITDPITPHLRAIDAVNPLDQGFKEAREAGITCVMTGPGSANPISGQFTAIKTRGRFVDEMLLNPPVSAMKFALGENPKTIYNDKNMMPVTRMATAALIREALYKARRYAADLAVDNDEDDVSPPEYDAKSEALMDVLSKKQKAHFHCHRADDIMTALRIGREFDLDIVLVHATEGHVVADILGERNIPTIVGPVLLGRMKPELKGLQVNTAAALDAMDVPVAICTDHPEVPIQYLPLSAAIAVKGGLSRFAALKAITLGAAQIAGIDHKVGSITVGKDADFVLFATGDDPLNVQSSPQITIINGVPHFMGCATERRSL